MITAVGGFRATDLKGSEKMLLALEGWGAPGMRWVSQVLGLLLEERRVSDVYLT